MAKQQVTLYIDDSSISVLLCKGRKPQKWSTVPLDPGLVKEGVVQDPVAVAAKIKQIWGDSRIFRKKVTFGISGINCLYQLLLLPELPDNLRSEAISREAAHSLGIPLEGVYLSWQVLSIEHGQMRVFLTVTPRDKVDAAVSTLKMAGLRPVVMDVKPLCLARASSEPLAIIVDTCQDAFDIVVLGQGIPEVVRSLYVAPGTPPGESIALLRGELERAVSFYNAAHMDKPIDLTVPVLVAGDLAGQDSERSSLAGPRERPVRNMESPFEGEDDFDPTKYMTCIGLALKEIIVTELGSVSHSAVNFNALPEIYQIRKRPLSEVLWLPTVLIGVVVIAMGIWGITYLKGENRDLAAQRDDVNRRMQEQLVTTSDVQALTTQVTTAEKPVSVFDGLLSTLKVSREATTANLNVIWQYADADSGVSLQRVDIDATNGEVTIRGSAGTWDQICSYGWRLYDSGRFSSVITTKISVDEDAGVTEFSITAK